jgi:hypothetical protein
LHAYVPGEQPKITGAGQAQNQRKSVSTIAESFARGEKCGGFAIAPCTQIQRQKSCAPNWRNCIKCKPENILVGNGSDEVLALAVRGFVEPSPKTKDQRPKSVGPILHAKLFALSGISGNSRSGPRRPWRIEIPILVHAERGGIEARQAMGF